jgi:hypothetical protein
MQQRSKKLLDHANKQSGSLIAQTPPIAPNPKPIDSGYKSAPLHPY